MISIEDLLLDQKTFRITVKTKQKENKVEITKNKIIVYTYASAINNEANKAILIILEKFLHKPVRILSGFHTPNKIITII
jgi:uncharacterized protein YggU (UPF0235/DUF167 family)